GLPEDYIKKNFKKENFISDILYSSNKIELDDSLMLLQVRLSTAPSRTNPESAEILVIPHSQHDLHGNLQRYILQCHIEEAEMKNEQIRKRFQGKSWSIMLKERGKLVVPEVNGKTALLRIDVMEWNTCRVLKRGTTIQDIVSVQLKDLPVVQPPTDNNKKDLHTMLGFINEEKGNFSIIFQISRSQQRLELAQFMTFVNVDKVQNRALPSSSVPGVRVQRSHQWYSSSVSCPSGVDCGLSGYQAPLSWLERRKI
ncbi:hypothetical protein C0J52_07618, partial [Blattella germanica]